MYFSPDLHQGSIESPVPFTLPSSGSNEATSVQSFDVQPNPFHTETMLRFALREAQEVSLTMTNLSGQTVSSMHYMAQSGLNTLTWKGQSSKGMDLSPGVYFIRLQTESGSVVQKVVLQ
ncbi:MAG: T9SS type A sorting domain-containing protein [Lewinellaceae bacterium]|nr:T9SS type A sorting domain-containing protein [Lewinellaceae bacterium]